MKEELRKVLAGIMEMIHRVPMYKVTLSPHESFIVTFKIAGKPVWTPINHQTESKLFTKRQLNLLVPSVDVGRYFDETAYTEGEAMVDIFYSVRNNILESANRSSEGLPNSSYAIVIEEM